MCSERAGEKKTTGARDARRFAALLDAAPHRVARALTARSAAHTRQSR